MSVNGRHNVEAKEVDRRNPGDGFLERETENNRKGEFWLLGIAAIAAAFVAVLILIREIFFV